MPRLLIVSPHFPPVNAPDHQRVRMSLPYLQSLGWETTVLAVDPVSVEAVPDPLLTITIPANSRVIYSRACPVGLTRMIGIRGLAFRSLPFLLRTGDAILSREKFDLVYFSTTLFPVMVLGPHWFKRYQVPYIVDFQDPWLSDYDYGKTALRPPGGGLKYGLNQLLAKIFEPRVLRSALGVTSVSPGYKKILLKRYCWLKEEQFLVIPFGAAEEDFSCLEQHPGKQSIFDSHDGKRHWVYVGRGGADMAFALTAFFQALFRLRKKFPERFCILKLHFIGTDYAPKGRAIKTVEPLAIEWGVRDLVEEVTTRIPYFEALQCLKDAEALIVFGSDDFHYTASKLYPYILARKPLLAIFHEQSSAVNVMKATKAGIVVTFGEMDGVESLSRAVEREIVRLFDVPAASTNTNWKVFEDYTARTMASRLIHFFEARLADFRTMLRG